MKIDTINNTIIENTTQTGIDWRAKASVAARWRCVLFLPCHVFCCFLLRYSFFDRRTTIDTINIIVLLLIDQYISLIKDEPSCVRVEGKLTGGAEILSHLTLQLSEPGWTSRILTSLWFYYNLFTYLFIYLLCLSGKVGHTGLDDKQNVTSRLLYLLTSHLLFWKKKCLQRS